MNLHHHFRALERNYETILPILQLLHGVISGDFPQFRLFLAVSELPRGVISRPGGFQWSRKLPNGTRKTRKKTQLVCNYEGLNGFRGVRYAAIIAASIHDYSVVIAGGLNKRKYTESNRFSR